MISGELDGRVALVTAAAGAGIGKAIATRLAADGATVIVTDVHQRRLDAAVAEIGGNAVGYLLDAGDRDQIVQVTDAVAAAHGPISILVNNAALNVLGPIFDYDPADWDRVMAVNLSGPWMLSRQVMRQLREAGLPGVILNVSTYAPDVGGEGIEAPYAVSKGGLNVLTRSCAHEGGPYGIRANTLSMGMVTGTRFTDALHPDMQDTERAKSPLGRLSHVDDIVEAAAFLISDRSRNITGETLNVAAGTHMRW
ncbi:SDR family NAD(P)-dependent oxidoreductase [Gordonia sp. (in: high G+C Gram-positive bacteria)]|jgi:NAD(P)-dependent dehydrogenase (short-subunit alcohol dehydrogenase family)|uniref:SDR family NAD(P)-dependent oxidoreductase n=1 Tax=Gordonia sp. (in: high G+C Gram-positive bacteria) TaxID=84139 RepID=UPI001DFA1E4C|nr:SDR family oxidoreductase [Gordonia sp. (in: high G+C Gram-positive bacteria)]MCB1297314.1 SDR family oxidoreductase [Gordonia sp. (in: high G+C Gram-positive bacteria)]HMS74895.1 SDR family oxidoreductase [Gordonia sp. (in: high G+C Gram-positive bacteria)]